MLTLKHCSRFRYFKKERSLCGENERIQLLYDQKSERYYITITSDYQAYGPYTKTDAYILYYKIKDGSYTNSQVNRYLPMMNDNEKSCME